ncbi:MAG: recombinase family protein [Actinomycetota bacterium]|nr:recombinase family protein [Actinomycetota bacterium]
MTTTAVLYARVSNRGQAERGLSIPGQLRELRGWAERMGYVVVDEVADTGGADSKRDVLDRPGLNRVLDLCENGQVDVVAAQSRDRFGEFPVPDMLAYRLGQFGTKLTTPDDTGEDDAAELMRMFQDWNSKRERRTTARRSRSRKLEQARQGYVVASHTPTYGFDYAGPKGERTYAVDEEHMAVVARIFRMVGAEGMGIRTVVRVLNLEGVPTPPLPNKSKDPATGRSWNRQFVRDLIVKDAYRPHPYEEVAALVAPNVAARLDPEKSYGIWWYEGTDYEGNKHRVAVPVPDAGIPREWIDAARRTLENNVAPSGAGGRSFWELSGGVLYCGSCGRRMQTHTVKSNKHGRVYHYYRCLSLMESHGMSSCAERVRLPAERTEAEVWRFVEEVSSRPERVLDGLDRLIEEERSRLRLDPAQDARALRERLGVLAARRAAYHSGVHEY